MPSLTIESATASYGTNTVFRGLDLTVRAGEMLAILGPNGRGKTTLLKALVGSLRLSAGERHLDGTIGYVPQAAMPTFDYPVRDMVLMGRARHVRFFGTPGAADHAAADAAIDRLGLAHLAERGVTTLSGGERQLVMIARALAGNSDILILDEPASALDLKNQRVLFDIIAGLAHEDGLAVVFTTHVPGHALAVADKALLMHSDDGAQIGSVETIVSDVALSRLYETPVRVLAEGEGRGRIAAAVALRETA